MTFAEVYADFAAGKAIALGNERGHQVIYKLMRGRIHIKYPYWDTWIKRDNIHIEALTSRDWNKTTAEDT